LQVLLNGAESIEPDQVTIINGDVIAVALNRVARDADDVKQFDADGVRVWRIISSTGEVTTLEILVGKDTVRRNVTEQLPVTWFLDTHRWVRALMVNESGDILGGSERKLYEAVGKGARVRLGVRFTNSTNSTYFEPDNFRREELKMAAMHVRSVGLHATPGNKTKVEFSHPVYWQLSLTNMSGKVQTSEWTVGKEESRGLKTSHAHVDWFVNY